MDVMKGLCLFVVLLMLSQGAVAAAGDANATQFFYIVKKLFPEASEIAVFISPETLSEQKTMLDRAAAQNKVKATVYLIETSTDVGKRIRELKENSILVIFDSSVLLKKSTQLYVLKNCKEKQISVFTSSREYSDLGALLGIIKSSDSTVNLVLNLKQNEYLKPKFTDVFIKNTGIAEVIQ